MSQDHLIDIHKTAERLGVKVHTLYGWVNQRRIPYVKVGRLVRFDPQDIEAWIEKNKVKEFKC